MLAELYRNEKNKKFIKRNKFEIIIRIRISKLFFFFFQILRIFNSWRVQNLLPFSQNFRKILYLRMFKEIVCNKEERNSRKRYKKSTKDSLSRNSNETNKHAFRGILYCIPFKFLRVYEIPGINIEFRRIARNREILLSA